MESEVGFPDASCRPEYRHRPPFRRPGTRRNIEAGEGPTTIELPGRRTDEAQARTAGRESSHCFLPGLAQAAAGSVHAGFHPSP